VDNGACCVVLGAGGAVEYKTVEEEQEDADETASSCAEDWAW